MLGIYSSKRCEWFGRDDEQQEKRYRNAIWSAAAERSRDAALDSAHRAARYA
jgi:hypothetical protein